MTILLDRRTAVIVHGAGGTVGTYQVKRMLSYGTMVVGLVSRTVHEPGEVPAFGSITEAQARFRAEVLVSYASVERVLAAAREAFDCGIATVTAVAEEVAFRDAVANRRSARASGFRFIGPNTNGILSPGEARVGFFSEEFATRENRTHLSKWDALLRRPE